MKIQIISVGKLSSEIAKLSDQYQKMTNWKIKNSEIVYSKKLAPTQIKQYEAKLIQDKISKGSYVVVLDLSGKQQTSEEFSSIFSKQMMEGRDIDFIIGGAFGLDQSSLKLSNAKLCLSKMTLPHKIAKLMLVEQIYRAQSILDGHPYHK
jgi:23S rRNA (pseudouridine1915-N3)-methyltransferase